MLSKVTLAAEAIARRELAAGDLRKYAIADAQRGRTDVPRLCAGLCCSGRAQIAAIAEGASGSVWPPSTTIVWPVMNFASSVARKSAA